MTGSRLPDGVSADNKAKARFVRSDDGDYRAPEMAVPDFARRQALAMTSKAARSDGAKFAASFEDDDRSAPAAVPPQVKKLQWIIAIAAVLAALGVIAIAMRGETLPLCSSQPDWNQYNCRAG